MFRLFVSIIAAAILTACASPGAHVADGKVSTHELLSGDCCERPLRLDGDTATFA